ncbi:hypothetical protein [Psychrobacillus psychrotolerans]|uniref:hypothetical protein n=1 Tax=Psychrobacillus psychrotolerans TaxID=126156 RepID=UPI003B01BECF
MIVESYNAVGVSKKENSLNKNNLTAKKGIHFYLSCLLIAYPVFYPANDIFGHFGQYGLFVIWLLVSLVDKPSFLVHIIKNSYIYIAFLLIIIIRVADVLSDVPFGFFSPHRLISQFSLLLIYYTFGLWHTLYSNDVTKSNLIKVFLNSFLISAIVSLYYLMQNEYAIRQSYNNSYFALGDFNLVYTGVLIVALIWLLTINKIYNFRVTILFLVSILLVVKASYMTAIVSIFILALLSTLIKFRKRYFAVFLTTLIFLLLVFSMDSIAKIIFDLANSGLINSALQVRLLDISNVLYGNSVANSGTLLDRFELSSVSWATFLDNPFFGVYYGDYGLHTIGGHTQWVDNLARFGVVGIMLLFLQMIIWFVKIYLKTKSKLEKNSLIISWLFFLFLGIINNNMLGGLFICMFFISSNINTVFKPKK